MKECKRHRWRVGSSNAVLKDKKIIKKSLNIWCEKCDKKIKAYYNSNIKFKRRSSSANASKTQKEKGK